MTEDKYAKLPKLQQTNLGSSLKKIDDLTIAYNTIVDKRNVLITALQRIEYNQIDRQIIDFYKSISAFGLSDGEWKSIVIKGVRETIAALDKKMSSIEFELTEIIKHTK